MSFELSQNQKYVYKFKSTFADIFILSVMPWGSTGLSTDRQRGLPAQSFLIR